MAHDADEDPFDPGDHPGALMATVGTPRAPEPTTLAVIADPHVATRASGTSKQFEDTGRHFRNAIADARARGVDGICSVGDLTKDGEPWNYAAVDDALADLSVPFYAVPGNHDVPKDGDDHDTPEVSWFAERYAPGGSFPFAADVGGVELVGVNTAGGRGFLRDTHDGGLDPAGRERVRNLLAAADAPLVLAHHNLPAMYDQLRAHRDAVEPEMGIPPITRDGEAVVDALAAGGVGLLLTGHLHMPATARQRGVRELMVPATCSFPQAYCLVTVGPGGTDVRFVPVAGRAGLRAGHAVRSGESTTGRELTAMAADRLARFPLVRE